MTEHRPLKTGCKHCNPPTYYGDNIQKVLISNPYSPPVNQGLDYKDSKEPINIYIENPPIDTPPFSLPFPKPTGGVLKPWGEYSYLYRSQTVVVKRITIHPGHRFSYQYHNNRDETWMIEKGVGQLIVDSLLEEVTSGYSVYIKRLQKHRLANIGDTDLVFYEIQYGDCSEDDIVRIVDDYGR